MKKQEHDRFPAIFFTIILIQTMMSISFFMVVPIVTKYLVETAGTTLAIAGILSGLMSYVSLFLRPVSGMVSDKWNLQKLLGGSVLLFGTSIIMYGLTSSPVLFGIFRVVSGVTFCLSSTAIYAFAGRYIPDSRMGAGVGYLGLGNIAASAIGPMFSTALSSWLGYGACFAIAGSFSVISGILFFTVPSLRVAGKDAEQKIVMSGNRKFSLKFTDFFAVQLVPIAILVSLFGYSTGTISNFLLLFGETRNLGNVTFYFTLLAISLFIVRPIIGRLSDRKGLTAALVPGLLLAFCGILLILNATHIWMILLAALLMAFGQGGGQPAVQAECLRRMSPQQRGVATGTFLIFGDMAQGLAPSVGGYVIQHSGYEAAFTICAVLFIVGLVYYLLLTGISTRGMHKVPDEDANADEYQGGIG